MKLFVYDLGYKLALMVGGRVVWRTKRPLPFPLRWDSIKYLWVHRHDR